MSAKDEYLSEVAKKEDRDLMLIVSKGADYIEELEQDKSELLGAIIGYRSGMISDKVFDELIAKHRRVQ